MEREEAIKWLTNEKWKNANNKYKKEWNEAFDLAIEALSADAEPKMTEEVREALMRLTMCAREECAMCKYKDKCGFEFQYNISTENMNTLLDALSADVVPQSEQYKKGFEDCKRAYEIELARSADRELANLKEEFESAVPNCKKCAIKELWEETEKEDLVEVVRCKDCKWFKKIVEKGKSGLCHYDLVARCLHDEDYCSHGERREE